MRLTMRALLAAALLAGWIPAAVRAQAPPPPPAPTPAPTGAEAPAPPPQPAAPSAAAEAPAPAPAPTAVAAPSVLRIVEPSSVSVAKLPAENPYGAKVDVPAALPQKLAFTDAAVMSGFFVSMHVDPTGRTLTARRERDPIPSLAGKTLESLQRWTFTPARRSGQAVDTLGADRLELPAEVDAPKVLQQSLSPVTATTPLPTPLAWPSDTEWLDSRRPAAPTDGTVSILEVDTAPIPQKTPWTADTYKGSF